MGRYADWSTTAGGGSISFVEIARIRGGPILAGALLPAAVVSILAAVNAVLLRWGFTSLSVIDVFLNMLSHILIFVAALPLRQTEPRMERPFKVRGAPPCWP